MRLLHFFDYNLPRSRVATKKLAQLLQQQRITEQRQAMQLKRLDIDLAKLINH